MGNGTVALETLLVFGLRGGFFFLASRYLKRALFADLRQVIHDETSLNTSTSNSNATGGAIHLSTSGLNSGHESPDEFDTSYTSPIGNGQSLRDQLYNLRPASTSSTSILPTSNNPRPTTSSPERERAARKVSAAKKGNNAASALKLAGTVFCLSVSECSTLFALIMFGGAISEKSRLLNWNLSLGAVLSIIVIVVPLGMCLLMSLRQRATSKSFRRTALFTAVPFLIYLLCLYELGEYIATLFGVERGSHTFGLFSTTLDRICVPGVALIATLSGGGAVITAWNAFEWRERFKAEAVTDGHINAAARSLAQTRTDLAARMAEVDALSSAAHDDESGKGFFSMFTSSPNAAKIKSLQGEIKGLEIMESQMSHDLQLMKRRKEIGELSKTWSGKALKALGWAFSVYCIYRVAMALLNLIFGSALSSGSGRSTPTDVTSAILSRVAEALGLEIDVHTWSKAVGLLLTGSIILVNINAVLGYVSRAFRATSAGVSASFMLLFLSQLMAVYLLTSLISLPHPDATDSGSTSSAILLDTLPDFRVFSRLFDAVFLLAAFTCFVLRYLQRKIRVDEHLGLQDFV